MKKVLIVFYFTLSLIFVSGITPDTSLLEIAFAVVNFVYSANLAEKNFGSGRGLWMTETKG